ncbi:MAG: PAS domain S-box protein [Acidobacteria bacterium]|nr:PAS domain S-box protein [Acidobacteriota bacterium]
MSAFQHPADADFNPLTALQAILAGTGDGAWYFDFREGSVRCSEAWHQMLGYKEGEVDTTAEGLLGLVHPEDLQMVRQMMEDHLAGRAPEFRSEHRLRTRLGGWVWVLGRGRVLLRDEAGAPVIAAGANMDITHQKAVEMALRASEARFRALAELSPVGIFLADESGCTFANEAWARITGWPLSESLGMRWAQAIHPEDRARARVAWEEAARDARGFTMETRYLTQEGQVRWGEVQVRPFPGIGPRGEGGFLGVVTDTTARHEAEQLLAQRLKELGDIKFALDRSAIVALTDASGTILEANDKFSEISGYSRGELVGRTHRIVKSGHHTGAFFQEMWGTISEGRVWHGEIQNRAKDGHAYWVDTTITPFLGEDGHPDHYLAIRFDISERHRVEEQLRTAERFLAHALESIPDTFVLLDAEDRLVLLNQSARDLLPEPYREGALGLPYGVLLRATLEYHLGLEGESLEAAVRAWQEGHRNPGNPMVFHAKDGRLIRVQERLLKDGSHLILGTDVTSDMERQDELSKAYLAAESANAGKDQFLAAVGHELKAPLHAILGHAELMLMEDEGTLTASQKRHVQTILDCGERQARLIQDLQDLAILESGRMVFHPTPVALTPILEGVASILSTEVGRRGLSISTEGGGLGMFVDGRRLDQVLLNLVSNAVKYNVAGGRVDIRASRVDGGRVRLEVSDTGRGIPLDRQGEVFEAYNRLGREGGTIGGSGLGLSLTRKLVEAMGGRIGFRSVPEQGSTFWVELPASG